VFIRVKVCDAYKSVDNLESNCTAYGSDSYKPTGLLQQYADKIRYSAFGYLNDSDLYRDGGVLRARQKFIGPTKPVPGGLPVGNPRAEWDAKTGVMLRSPDSIKDGSEYPDDVAATNAALGITIADSGVMNYLNKFGEIKPGAYKHYDPVSELYYGVQRYFRNKGNVQAWSSMGSADKSTRETFADGFPVITEWKDPIQYSCQRNFILGIGDVNTNADRNLPGATGKSENGPPPEDAEIDATKWTNKVGELEGLRGSLGTIQHYGGCCNNNGALIAGLAYWGNTTDVRPDLPGMQTIKTYWLDILEYQKYKTNNQFYLAAKYGGFNPPNGFEPLAAKALEKEWWATTKDVVTDGRNSQQRPDNYFTAARADQMVEGLTKTFSSIASQLNAYTTSFATASPQVSALGVATYSTKYDAKAWTGELIAGKTVFNEKTGEPDLAAQWRFSEVLAVQAAGTGWKDRRNIVSYDTAKGRGIPFRADTLPKSQLQALNTTYSSGNDAVDYLNYLRGERTNERSSTAAGSTHAYRDRASLVGDIVNARARPVGPPSAPYSDASNPGYAAFKAKYAKRRPMVYVGTNAGMLHAVDGSLTGDTAGKELWAYVPGGVFQGPGSKPSVNGLASVGNPDFVHHYLLDASPLAFDVDLGNTPGGSGTDWRTLLIGGLGKGGKTIYALDITDPSSVTSEADAAQNVLWEFTDPQLGFTYGQPAVVKTRKYGWVVVAGSGYNNSGGQGYFFFINPRNGALLEKVAAPCSECSNSRQAGLAQVNAFVLDLTDGVADAIYGGDLMGNVWRVDVTGTGNYPKAVKFATLVGSDGQPLPITSRPLPVVQPITNRRYITVGTGRLLDSSDLNSRQAQRFFAIIDGTNAQFSNDGKTSGTKSDLPPGVFFPLTVSNMRQLTDLNTKITLDLRSQVGWFVDLGATAGGAGWRVLTDPTSFYGTVAFAATAPSTADACSPGGISQVYALDLGTGACALEKGGASCTAAVKGVINDLMYYSVNVDGVGKSQLIAGNDGRCSGSDCKPVELIATRPPAKLGLKRMSWREIQN
ncbi:MAG TPA: PilC/PilY family type IV pilus protein, partial [Roseateles sp.]